MTANPLDLNELLELYKIHVAEVRFQTEFNWKRTQYFLILNVGMIGVAGAILESAELEMAPIVICSIFAAGLLMCLMSISALRQGHRYYRRAVLQKTKVELMLGLFNVDTQSVIPPFELTTSSTPGKEEAMKYLSSPDEYMRRPLVKVGQINWYIQAFLLFLSVINLSGLVLSIVKVVGSWPLL